MPAELGEAPSPDELRDRLDAEVTRAPANVPSSKNAREYVFPFRFEGDGRTYEGTFKNRILTVGDRMRAGALASDLVAGRAFSSLPGAAQQLAVAISWMTYSLDREMRPDWARDLSAIEDERVIFSLYGEVWDHQSTFLGKKDDPEPKAGPRE